MADIISKATKRAFQESYVQFSVLREIANDFDDAGVDREKLPPGHNISGARRGHVEMYYRTVDWTSQTHVRRVLDAFEVHLNRLEDRDINKELARLIKFLKRDGLSYYDRKIQFTPDGIHFNKLDDQKMGVDLSQLRVNIDRIKKAVDDDPGLAIGSAKELVESCCKAILNEREVVFSQKADIPELVRTVAKELKLIPANVPESKKGSASIRRVLGNLVNIVQGLAELRNLYGTGHGKEPGRGGLGPRHARLCVGAASTLCNFFMETAIQRKKK